MAFIAETCIFDGVSCADFDLVLARGGSSGDDSSQFASPPTISDLYLPRKWRPHFYGVTRPNKLTFQLSMVLNGCRIDSESYLTRAEIKSITEWLTAKNTYSWLDIVQPDMYSYTGGVPSRPIYRYRCMVTGLELLFINDQPYGVTATVTCDSPYAYKPGLGVTPFVLLVYDQDTYASVTKDIVNNGSVSDGVFPKFTMHQTNNNHSGIESFSIRNNTTGEELTISSIPAAAVDVTIDCENCVISASDGSNLYQYCNFVFPRLAPGSNSVTISASFIDPIDGAEAQIAVSADIPVDIGA